MEDCKLKKSSGDKFSFPVMSPQEEKQLEFGCSWGTPADNFFFNGRLLPHAFPSQPANTSHGGFTYSRSASRTSSGSSNSSRRDSLMSSRSNSTGSRNSGCNSARTSTSSEAPSERRILLTHHAKISSKLAQVSKERNKEKINNKPSLMTPEYGSSRRWQFIRVPVPGLNRQASRSKKKENVEMIRSYSTSKKEYCAEDRTTTATGTATTSSSKAWFGRRLFFCFVSACVECHAMKTSSTEKFS